MNQPYNWGGHPAAPQTTFPLFWLSELNTKHLPEGSLLAHGNGRSQGDVGLNTQGTLILMRGCNRLIHWDAQSGELTAEAGITLHEIMEFAVPRGYMLPVVPGTRFITLGGAIANDVHGKNHHAPVAEGGGSFGHHISSIGLWRTDKGFATLTPTDALFKATIGGLGLTGVIAYATVRLVPVTAPTLMVQNTRLEDWATMYNALLNSTAPYSVAWLDLSAPTSSLGRGWLEEAVWESNSAEAAPAPRLPKFGVPFRLPFNLWNKAVVRAFNGYWYKWPRATQASVPYAKFLWPLDGVANWRNSFGKASFVQCQMVVPTEAAGTVLLQALQMVQAQGKPTFLNTLKRLGAHEAAGLMSFPREGLALALDMLYEGNATDELLRDLETLARDAGGALYPAKDSAMTPEAFTAMYPAWRQLEALRDPRITSDFWQRVTKEESQIYAA
jgi:FAD/FMN-containing dehydrogenase